MHAATNGLGTENCCIAYEGAIISPIAMLLVGTTGFVDASDSHTPGPRIPKKVYSPRGRKSTYVLNHTMLVTLQVWVPLARKDPDGPALTAVAQSTVCRSPSSIKATPRDHPCSGHLIRYIYQLIILHSATPKVAPSLASRKLPAFMSIYFLLLCVF